MLPGRQTAWFFVTWCALARQGGHAVSTARGRTPYITAEKLWLDGVLPLDGSRIAGQSPPVVAAPAFAIRNRAVAVLALDDYVAAGARRE